MTNRTAADYLDEGAKTYRERNAVYGDNFKKVGAVMAALFPEGVFIQSADDWNRLHIFLLGIVKQTRYVTNWDKGGHADSVHDNTVYSAMLEAIDQEIRERVIMPAAKEALKCPTCGDVNCNDIYHPPFKVTLDKGEGSAPVVPKLNNYCHGMDKCNWRTWPESDGQEEVCVTCQRLRQKA